MGKYIVDIPDNIEKEIAKPSFVASGYWQLSGHFKLMPLQESQSAPSYSFDLAPKNKSLPTADLPETVAVQMPRACYNDGEFSYSYDDVQISLEKLAEKLAPILFDYDKLGEKLGKWLNDRDQQKLSNRMMEYVDDKLHPIPEQWSRQEQWEIFYQVRAERDQYKAERDMYKTLYELSIGGKSFLSHR